MTRLNSVAVFLTVLFSLSPSYAQIDTSGMSNEPNVGRPVIVEGPGSYQQNFHLPSSFLASELLSVSEIRALMRTKNDPREFESGEVRFANFHQQDGQSVENDDSPEEELVEYGPPNVKGRTLYSSMDLDQLEQKLKEAKAATSSDEQISSGVKAARLQIVSSANDSILKIREAIGQRKAFLAHVDNAENQESLKEKLEPIDEPAELYVDDATTSESLIDELQTMREELGSEKQKLVEFEAKIQQQLERVTQIPSDRANANAELEQLQEQISQLREEPDDMDSQLTYLLLEVKRRAAEHELEKLDAEQKSQQLGGKIDPIERDIQSRVVSRLEEEVRRWEMAVKNLRKNEVREEQLEASQKVETAHWSLKPLAERNELIVKERRELVEKFSGLRAELTRVRDLSETIVQRRNEIENKIEAAGLTATNGMLLVDLRRNLESTGESHIRIRQLQSELRRVNLKKVGLNEERDELADPRNVVEELVGDGESDNPLLPTALEFVEKKRDYLDQLIVEYQSYGREVSEVSQSRKKLIDEINRTLGYIDENALWIRSAEPVGLSDFVAVKEGIDQFFAADQWTELACTTQQHAIGRPYESAMATLFFLGMLIVNRRVKRKLDPENEQHESST